MEQKSTEHKTPRVGDSFYGFTVISVKPVEEYKGTGIRLRHDATGLDAYHLFTEDRENLFAFAFKTPPSDNTGAAHILEHTVLSGSKKYPIKDPFLALMKGSMNTFLNAMTYPDKTVYPASTVVEKDYFNLMNVYADAVFNPLLKRELFLQEGYRLVPREDGEFDVDGVVFNEMKGNYSSFESIVGEWSYRSVFTDSQYAFDSGGEPREIPRLTYEGFTDFHRRYYHPSNCRLFLYGDIPTERQCKFLQEEYLSGFGHGKPVGDVTPQSRWESPRRFTKYAPADEDSEGKSTIIVNWLTERTAGDPLAMLTVQVLSDILIGHPGTPLYKRVVDSGLGEDVSPSSGLESDIAEPVFSIGVRGALSEKREAFEELVTGELRRLADEGIPEQLARGALNRVEFRNREIKGGAPFGLRLMGKALRGWLHGEDPETTLEFSRHMEELKRRYEEEPGYFEGYIRRLFVDNPHRSTVTVEPTQSYLDELEGSIAESVKEHPHAGSEKGRKQVEEDFKRFRVFQETPDSPEDIERIPVLSKEDLPEDISTIKTEREEVDFVPLFSHKLFTNGIAYVDIAFNLKGLSDEDLKLMPLLGKMITASGAGGVSYDEIARRLALSTGGLYHSIEASPLVGRPDEVFVFLLFRLKSLASHAEEALDLAKTIISGASVDDAGRLREVLFEYRNDMRSAVIPSGHSFAALRAGAHLKSVIGIEDEWRGIGQLEFLSSIGEDGGPSLDEIAEKLKRLRDKIITRERMLLNITAGDDDFAHVQSSVEKVTAALAEGGEFSGPGSAAALTTILPPGPNSEDPVTWESLIVPAAVGYSALVLPAATYGERAHPLQVLFAHLLKTDYLWERIRMQGGAYGTFAAVNALEGVFSLISYRDPDAGRSLGVFEEAFRDFSEKEPDSKELEKAVIAVVGKDARPKSPGEKSIIGLRRSLYGITDESRRDKRRRMLEAVPGDISAQAASMLTEFSRAVRVVLAGEKMALKAEELFSGDGEKTNGEKKRTRVQL
ncbi:MAG: insulinase family protein [Spirochaetaceae bacterium]